MERYFLFHFFFNLVHLPSWFSTKEESLFCFQLQLIFYEVHHFFDRQYGFRLLHFDRRIFFFSFQLESIESQ